MADQAGEAHRRDQGRTLRPRGLEVERGRVERTARQALGAEVEALLPADWATRATLDGATMSGRGRARYHGPRRGHSRSRSGPARRPGLGRALDRREPGWPDRPSAGWGGVRARAGPAALSP
jgi:hypothetical protein